MRIVSIFFLSIIGLSLNAQSNNNFQYWLITNLKAHISPDMQISFQQRYNFGFDEFHTRLNLFEVGIAYDVTDWFNLGLSYKQLYFNDGNSGFYSENRPQLAGTFSARYSDFRFSLRNRLDYRHFEVKETYFSYNNKFTLRYMKFPFQPFISEELFYNIEVPKIELLRLTSGLYMALKYCKIEVYYGYEISSSSVLRKTHNAFGNTISFEF